MYENEYGGFKKIMEREKSMNGRYEMIVAYKREIPAGKGKAKASILLNEEKQMYDILCSIRGENHIENNNFSFEETVKTEKEAKELMFSWIDEHKLKLVVEPTKYI